MNNIVQNNNGQFSMWLRLIGPPCLFTATGQPKRLATKKQIALLVYLNIATGRRGVRRDTIVDLLWPTLAFDKGRQSLSQGLSEIRNRLGADAVTRGGDSVSLLQPLRTDITDLENLDLESMGNATPLEDLENVSGADFAHWVEATRASLKNDLRHRLNTDIDKLRARGDRMAVRERAAQLYGIDPANVRAVSILAEAANQQGNRDAAEQLIENALELNDGARDTNFAALRTLLERLRSSVRAHHSADFAKPPITLVGRSEELRLLHATVADSNKMNHTAVLITGPPGLGKSTIADQFATELRADGQFCLRIVCQSGDDRHVIVKNAVQELAKFPELGSTDPKWLTELCRVAPFLRTSYPGIPGTLGEQDKEFAAISGATALANAIDAVAAGRRVTIWVENIDHADASSVSLLNALLNGPPPFPLILLATTSCDHNSASSSQQNPVDLIPWTEVLTLKPLKEEPCRELIRQTSIFRDFAVSGPTMERIVGWTRGSPLLIDLVLADLQTNRNYSLCSSHTMRDAVGSWEPTPRVRAQLERRFKSFWVVSGAAADCLAVSRRPLTIVTLCRVTSRSEENLRTAFQIGLDAGVLASASHGFTFSSTLLRGYARSRLCDQRLRHCHHLLANDIVRQHEPGSPGVLDAIHHLRLARDSKGAAQLTQVTARLFLESGDLRAAEALLRRSLHSPKESQESTRLLLARAVTARGRYEEAIRLLRRLNSSKLKSDEVQHRSILLTEATNCLLPTKVSRQNATSTTSIEKPATPHDGRRQDLALLLAGETAAQNRNWDDLRRIGMVAQRKSSTRTADSCYLSLAFCQMTQGLYDQAISNFQRSTILLGHHRKTIGLARAFNGIGTCAFALGRFSAAVSAFKSAHNLAHGLGNENFASAIASNLSATYTDYDFPRKATWWLQRSTGALSRQNDRNRYRFSVLANMADHAVMQGEPDRGIDTVERGLGNVEEDPVASAQLHCARADLLLAQNDWTSAVQEVEHVERAFGFTTTKRIQRFVPGFDSPHLARLLFLKAWYSGAKDTTRRMGSAWPTAAMSLAQHVELLAVFGWCAEQDDPRDRANTARHAHNRAAELVQLHGLSGVLRRLKFLGVLGKQLQPLIS